MPAYAVPSRRTDLAGLPSAWIGVGDIELFRDEDVAYARALQEAGVPTTLEVVPGAPHASESIAASSPVSEAYLDRAHRWLRDQLERS